MDRAAVERIRRTFISNKRMSYVRRKHLVSTTVNIPDGDYYGVCGKHKIHAWS